MSAQAAPKSILKKKATMTVASSSKASSSKPSSAQPKLSVKVGRKRKVEPESEVEEVPEEDDEEANASGFEDDGMEVDAPESELDTGDEIDLAKNGGGEKSKKNTKRKRPATSATTFGSTLTSLLAAPTAVGPKFKKPKTDTNTITPILSLSNKRLPPSVATVSLENRAARKLKLEKEEKEDRARIRDVVEGWSAPGATGGGQEWERGLRKVAQRGVIKLFNAILVASNSHEEADLSLADRAKIKTDGPKNNKEKDNILGRGGKEDRLTKEGFLDMVRKGGK